MVVRYPMRVKRGDETVCIFSTDNAWITTGKDWFRYDSSMQDLIKVVPGIVEPFIVAYDSDAEPDEGFMKEIEWVLQLFK